MHDRMRINQQITVGGQPTAEQIRQLAEEGFRSVVNLRQAGEEGQPLSPDEEGDRVRELGMQYTQIPVPMKSMQPESVDRFRRELPELPTPIYIHCRGGKRAGALTMMHMAVENGWSGDDALQRAEQMGFQCDTPELREFVKNYIETHQK